MDNLYKFGFDNIKWVEHGFFNRLGGVSSGEFAFFNCGLDKGDVLENVLENHRRLAEHFGISRDNLLFLEQIHSNKVITVDKCWDYKSRPKADATVTDKPNIAIAVATADCVPILMADKKKKVIAAVHAGWKSAFTNIIEESASAMEKLGAKRENIEAVIGPCIRYNSYEVNDEYKNTFVMDDAGNEEFFKPSPREGRFLFNLAGYAASKLVKAGIKDFKDIDKDTLISDKIFFSNRRSFLESKSVYGVQPSVIMIKE